VLQELGFQVHFVGRKLPNSMPADFSFPYTRFKLWFSTGFLFYANYNLRLFWFLVQNPFDVYLSNDLDTLMPNALISKWRKKPLVYDSHEYFTGVPEIQQRPLVKWFWQKLERWFLPKADAYITVNKSIAKLYSKEYGLDFKVVRNIGNTSIAPRPKTRMALGLPEDAFILINQGSGINVDRGMEEMLEAMPLLPPRVKLLIVGSGDVLPLLKKRTAGGLEKRVIFKPKMPYAELLQYTRAADCGLSLDKDTNLNYRYSLPNKLFDYINSGIPLLVSDLPEVAGLVKSYSIGVVTENHDPQALADAVQQVMLKSKKDYQAQLEKAAAENNWSNEKRVLEEIFKPVA
jgi:glycosyltransferase involved in cell wall biosynthesis